MQHNMTDEQQVYNRLADRRNLYHISQSKNGGYDTYSDAVVAAWTEDEARNIRPDGSLISDPPGYEGRISYDWTDDIRDVTAELIGLAVPGIKGVICASFHAG
jgi:hypothetical protein